jgi:hypothetical protein
MLGKCNMSIQSSNSSYTNSRDTAFTANTARRIVEANVEPVPLEELVANLRKAFVGKHEQLCEARFEEMVDILAEHRDEADSRFESLAKSVLHLKDDQCGMDDSLRAMNEKIGTTSERLIEEFKALKKYCDDALVKSRQELEFKIQVASESHQDAIDDLSQSAKRGLLELSGVFFSHVAEDEKKWERERDNSHAILEQRIAQWRAEIEDSRRSDMHEVASSMVGIGHRLMALRKN